MRIEFMLYFYGAVCISMLAFNVAYAVLLRSGESRLTRRTRRLTAAVEEQLGRLDQGLPVDSRHLSALRRKLRRVNNLTAFDRTLRPLVLQRGDDPSLQAYLIQLQPCILYLALVYRKRETTQTAYFSYFLSRYMLQQHMPVQSLQDVLLSYMARENLYCRVNALQALCSFGNAQHVMEALHLQDRGSVFLHEKILTETLLTYTGDHGVLISMIWDALDTFSPHTQLALLNYIRFRSGSYPREMFALMEAPGQDKEVRLSAIRYFGRYHYAPALEPLLAFAADQDPSRWEYATVSASSLARYPGEQTVEALKQALHSGNWYIRCAAAASLEAQQVDYADLMDIVNGDDRYAREIMTYQRESHRIQKAGVAP